MGGACDGGVRRAASQMKYFLGTATYVYGGGRS